MSRVIKAASLLAAPAALVLAALGVVLVLSPEAEATFPGSNGRIAFVRTDAASPGNRDIWTMKPDGTDQRNLTASSPALDVSPDWSRDGQKIAFMSTRDGNPEIYMMDADGSNQTRVTSNPAADVSPSWSTNGRTIVFDIEMYPFERVAEAWERQAVGANAKLVVTRT